MGGVVTRTFLLFSLAWLVLPSGAGGTVSLEVGVERGRAPRVFSDHMVLQRQVPVPVYGRADPGEQVTVTFAGQQKTTVADAAGAWSVELEPMDAGGPFQMTISGSNQIVLDDVLVGEVWVCSGQSNMAIATVSRRVLAEHPQIRTLRRRDWRDRPAAVPFAFAVELQAALGVPVGLLNHAVRGAAIWTWLGNSIDEDPDPEVRALIDGCARCGRHYRRFTLPLQPYAIRGIAWWQGESALRREPGEAQLYRYLLPGLIRSWRTDWGRGAVPFLFVQLPSGGGLQLGQTPQPLPVTPADAVSPREQAAVALRDAFITALDEPATGMVISTDIDGGAHPKNREQYAARLARLALGTVYGQQSVYSGPVYSSMSVEGNRIRIRFRERTADGLVAAGGGPLQGFSISADGETFVWAQAEIEGSEVVVWHDAIAAPTVVRYGWAKDPDWANLFNGAGLGAAPFSTAAFPNP